MKKPVVVAVVELLCLLCWGNLNHPIVSEATQTHPLTVRNRIFLKSNREQLGLHRKTMFNAICRMRCVKAGLGKVLINLQDCSRKCLKLLKTGRSSFLDGQPRKRRSYHNYTSHHITSRTNNTKTLPGFVINGNIRILGPNVDISKLNLTTLNPSVPPPTLSQDILKTLFKPNVISGSCQNVIGQTSNNSPNPSGEMKSLPLVVNVTFSGSNGGPWRAMVSWKYNLTEKKRMRNITGYMVYWNSDSYPPPYLNCQKLAQNQTTVNISADDGWEYPDNLYLTVQPIPAVEKKDLELTAFSPKRRVKRNVPGSLPIKEEPYGVIVGGIVVGLVLVVYVSLTTYARFRNRTASSDKSQDQSEESNLRLTEIGPFLISYYPESEKVVKEVELMCTWLRHQGYNTLMDKMASVHIAELGRDRWIQQQIKKAKKILIVKTTNYLKLYEEDLKGKDSSVSKHRLEVHFMANEYCNTLSGSKFICIELEGCKKAQDLDCPPWMEHVFCYPRDREKLLRRMSDRNSVEIV